MLFFEGQRIDLRGCVIDLKPREGNQTDTSTTFQNDLLLVYWNNTTYIITVILPFLRMIPLIDCVFSTLA